MIYKPYALYPSTLLSDGHSVIDATKAQTFSYLTRGDKPVAYQAIQFYDDSVLVGSVPTSGYYQDKYGNPITMDISVAASVFADHSIVNGNSYSWRLLLWESAQASYTTSNATVISNWVSFTAQADPTVVLDALSSTYYDSSTGKITSKRCMWTATYTSNSAVRYQHWSIYDADDVRIYDTGDVIGCYPLQCYFDGLLSDVSYYAVLSVCNQLGQITTVTGTAIPVEYSNANNFGAITTTLQSDGGVKVDLSGYAGIRGTSAVTDGYAILPDIPIDGKNSIAVADGNTIAWDDDTALTAETYRLSVQAKLSVANNGDPICTLYADINETYGIQMCVGLVDGLKPSAALTPSATLAPSAPKYFVQIKDAAQGTALTTYSSAAHLISLSSAASWYYMECIFVWSGSGITVSSVSVTAL